TDTLDPPTALAATGGLTAALAWTATVDTYATGYNVARATVSGGPYSVVSTVSPRTIVATTDAPTASGTYYYVLQSYLHSWTAAKSVGLTATAITAYTLGATNDTWGRTWLGSEFANGSFRVRLTDVTNQTTKSFRLDGLSVQVTYTP